MTRNPLHVLTSVGTVLFLLVVGTLLLGYVLGQPLLLAYIETGSMEPTIQPGDGVVVVPPEVAGPVVTGDVIMFDAEYTDGGGLVTHRVIDETTQGYITKGDANLVTDQDSGEPPITEGQIKGVVLQVDASVITIPHLGTAAETVQTVGGALQQQLSRLFGTDLFRGMQGQAVIMFAIGGLAILLGLRAEPGAYDRQRSRSRSRSETIPATLIMLSFAVIFVSAATFGMLLPAGTTTYEVVSSESDAGPGHAVPAGGSDRIDFPVANQGLFPTQIYLEPASEGIQVENGQHQLGYGEMANATVIRSAPPETGLYYRSVVEYRYYALLPEPVIDWLYHRHPWLPLLMINALIAAVGFALGRVLLGTRTAVRIRSRTRSRESRNKR